MKLLRNTIAVMLLSMLGTLLTVMLITKPASASWQSWPSQFIIGLLRTSTAESARSYLGIETGSPPSTTGTGTGMEMGADTSSFYVSLGSGTWAVINVSEVIYALQAENGTALQSEAAAYLFAE